MNKYIFSCTFGSSSNLGGMSLFFSFIKGFITKIYVNLRLPFIIINSCSFLVIFLYKILNTILTAYKPHYIKIIKFIVRQGNAAYC